MVSQMPQILYIISLRNIKISEMHRRHPQFNDYVIKERSISDYKRQTLLRNVWF